MPYLFIFFHTTQELNLTPNPGYKDNGAQKGDAYTDHQAARYICPVTSLEMNGKYRFAFVWTCGCVVSERALKEVPSPICHKVGTTEELFYFVSPYILIIRSLLICTITEIPHSIYRGPH